MTGIIGGFGARGEGGRVRRAVLLQTTALVAVCLAGAAGAAETAQAPVVLDPVKVEDNAPSARAAEGYVAKRTTTATKTDTPLRDVPQSVSVVTEEAIKDQAMQGMADVVRYMPGITAGQGEGNRDQLTIRGNNTTADFFTDGVRDDAQYFRDLYNVERVEALKGPNAMIFGRGGGGGVVNRVLKEADGRTVRELSLRGGSFGNKRASADIGQALTDSVAARLNAMVEKSATYRDYGKVERYGVNPTVTFTPGDRTRIKLSYEYVHDDRTADRGIPSFRGRPLSTGVSTFFGNPELSRAETNVHTVDALVEHEITDSLTIRNRSRFADYDKFYQNVFPGAVNAAGTRVSLSAYNHAVQRQNLFNQTDLVFDLNTGPVKHKMLAGVEVGRQKTDQFRNTGYFPGNATSLSVPLSAPTVFTPVIWRQAATDANGRTIATVAGAYIQDQIELTDQVQVIAGLRYDRFNVDFHNNRNGQDLDRTDGLWSPRLGLVYKPVQPLSLYASYSVSYLPGSGDQFTTLTGTTVGLEPEKFVNLEVGAKWDVNPNLSLTAALFQLDRDNTSAPDPNNPARVVQTGSQRSRGFELGLTGNITEFWQVVGGYALQHAEITSRTATAFAGSDVPLVPRHTVSLWNKYQFTPMWGAGVGVIHQSSVYAGADNAVSLPGFTRFDAAVYAKVTESVRVQLNVQNLFDRKHYSTAHSNNNITPGAPRTVLVSLTSTF
jgi:catecholate siderophore receptor